MNPSFPPNIIQNVNIQWEDNALILKSTTRPYKYCLIFLQGRNMSVSHFLGVFLAPPLLELLTDFKIIFPIPTKRPFMIKPDVVKDVFSWYNNDDNTVFQAKARVEQIIKTELIGVDNDMSRIFLGGFSQGCFLSLWVINEMKEKLGGVLLTAGFRLKAPQLNLTDDLPPILVVHGLKDNIVKWKSERLTYGDLLDKKSVKTVLLEDMNHDLAHKGAQEVIYSFLRGIIRGEAKAHL